MSGNCGSEGRPPLPDQRVGALQVDVIRNHHQGARGNRRVERAGGVGGEHHLGAEQGGESHRGHHLLRPVTLVEVEPAVHDQDGLLAAPPQGHGLAVAHQLVERERKDLGQGHLLGRLPARHVQRQPDPATIRARTLSGPVTHFELVDDLAQLVGSEIGAHRPQRNMRPPIPPTTHPPEELKVARALRARQLTVTSRQA